MGSSITAEPLTYNVSHPLLEPDTFYSLKRWSEEKKMMNFNTVNINSNEEADVYYNLLILGTLVVFINDQSW